MMHRAVDLRPTTLDERERTVQAVLATATPVQRADIDGRYSEVLQIDPSSVDLAALPVPLLDHHRGDARSTVGTVRRAWIEGNQLVGELRVSEAEPSIWAKLADGTLRSLSAGYRVREWAASVGQAGERIRTAVRWSLHEASLTSTPLDAAARVRSMEEDMDHEQNGAPAAEGRTEVDTEIRALVEQHGCAAQLADGLIAGGADVASARMAVLADLRQRSAQVRVSSGGGADFSDPASLITRMQGALLHRADPATYELPDASREFRGRNLLDLCADYLGAQGIRTRGMSPDQLLTRSLGGMHHTSDFGTLFVETGQRLLEDRYRSAASVLKSHSRQRSARDFRPLHNIRFGNVSPLEPLNEHGEIVAGTIDLEKETLRVKTFARLWTWSREMIINDDLDSLSDFTSEMAAAAAELEAGLFVDLLTANGGLGQTLDDGVVLFHEDHGNVSAAGTAIDVDALAAARLAMRSQRGIGGVFPIGLTPRALVVSPEKETEAEVVLATLAPAEIDNVNVFSGRLALQVEPRLSGNRWYIIGDGQPFQHAYLAGAAGPQMQTQEGFVQLGLSLRVVFDVGASIRDHRFIYSNAGA